MKILTKTFFYEILWLPPIVKKIQSHFSSVIFDPSLFRVKTTVAGSTACFEHRLLSVPGDRNRKRCALLYVLVFASTNDFFIKGFSKNFENGHKGLVWVEISLKSNFYSQLKELSYRSVKSWYSFAIPKFKKNCPLNFLPNEFFH